MSAHDEVNSKQAHIIGGMFGLEVDFRGDLAAVAVLPRILAGPHLRLVMARSAFALLARTLRPAAVWLPSYLCGAVRDAFAGCGPRINFFPVDEDLTISGDAWIAQVQPTDIVVFIDYFGFNAWEPHGKVVRERGAWVIEDACQAMLNTSFSRYAHYVIASPRKFFGVADGGILLAQDGVALPPGNLPPVPREWWLDALKASQLRAEFDRHGGDRKWFELFRKTDSQGPLGPMRMSELSSLLLDHAIDYQDIARKRRRNFSHLAAALPKFAMFRELSSEVVPLGFPVRVRQRDAITQDLAAREIYPPVHWSIRNVVPEEYQRYSPADMDRLCQTFESLNPSPIAPLPTPAHELRP
jgi:dTDP-4-amino-4,6-dideoxygalactose transaminase